VAFVPHPRGVIRLPRMVTRLARVATLLSVAALGLPAAASAASCPAQPTTTPFAPWGDTSSYFLTPGGDFEAPLSSSGWLVAGAERTAGNEPFHVGGAADASSLTIGGGGVAISPAFCFDATMPSLRFFAHALAGGGTLQVRLAVLTADGPVSLPADHVADLPAATMRTWAPTGQLPLTDGPGAAGAQAQQARLVFDVTGRGIWQIDDIYVDPYRMG
jgi:hypothetical protein